MMKNLKETSVIINSNSSIIHTHLIIEKIQLLIMILIATWQQTLSSLTDIIQLFKMTIPLII
jgi:hypothetical protein